MTCITATFLQKPDFLLKWKFEYLATYTLPINYILNMSMIDKIISSGISTVMWGEENHVTGRCHVTCSERSLPAVAATSTPQLDEDAD